MPDTLQNALDNGGIYESPHYRFNCVVSEGANHVKQKINYVTQKIESIPVDFKAIGEVALRTLFIGGGAVAIGAAFACSLPIGACIGLGILGYLAIGVGCKHYSFAPLNGRDFHVFKQPNC